MAREPTHIAFVDETSYNIGRYRGICLITLNIENYLFITDGLKGILQESSATELKWNRLGSARTRFAALKVIDCIVEWAVRRKLRVDSLVWDIEDSRHSVQGRSDIRNLRRMFYFLFKDVLTKRWPPHSIWKLCPDESDARVSSHLGYLSEIRNWDPDDVIQLNIKEVVQVKSEQEPLIQVADLFAGLAIFSRDLYGVYEQWLSEVNSGTEKQSQLSRTQRERCTVLAYFDKLCKRNKLGVSLKHGRGLRTFHPDNPVNFWWYEPQGEYDKAPIW